VIKWQDWIWDMVAVVVGIGLALLPLPYALLAFTICVLGIGACIDIRIALIVTLFIAPFRALLETEFPALQSLPLDIGQILLFWSFALWLARTITHRERLLYWTPMYIPLLILIVLALPSFWNTIAPDLGIKELAKWIEMLVLVALVLSTTRNSTTWLIVSVILTGCVQAVLGITQFLSESGPDSFRILDNHFRAYGSFGNPDPFAGFMSLCLCVAVGAFIHQLESMQHHFRQRWMQVATFFSFIAAGCAVCVLGSGLVFSWSRGAWVGFGMAMAMMLVCFPRRWRTRVTLLATSIILIALTLAVQLIPSSIVSRLSGFTEQFTGFDVRGVLVTDDNYALIERLAHWQSAIAMADDYPVFGVGLGGYPVAYPQYALPSWPLALGHAHNYYLNLLAEIGIVGLTGYLIAVGGIFWLMIKILLQIDGDRAFVVGILGAWIGLSIHNVFDMLYVNNMFIHVGVLLGLCARYRL
jgi:putative inorganic carbon (hco3(-)) transporter